MGFRITRYFVDDVPANAQVELGDLILCEDPRTVLHGRVLDCEGNPVAGCIVNIFSAPAGTPVCLCDQEGVFDALVEEGHVFTDECGQFIFPVCPVGRIFLIKLFALASNAVVTDPATACANTLFNCCDPACSPTSTVL